MINKSGCVSAGEKHTADAAIEILRDGGNAYDATIAAILASCVTEPVLSSLGGGGFLLAAPAQGAHSLFDFFAQTPKQMRPASELDFFAINADFGPVQQEFHIGYGSAATPGVPAGIFAIHQALGAIPLHRIIEPACRLARDGVPINSLQAHIMDVVHPIMLASASSRQYYENNDKPGQVLQAGMLHRIPDFADILENMARGGPRFFYEGDVAENLLERCKDTGSLRADDLRDYKVIRRRPLKLDFDGVNISTNPAPSSGGILIAFALDLLKKSNAAGVHGSSEWLINLACVMEQTNLARHASGFTLTPTDEIAATLLADDTIQKYLDGMKGRALKSGGTTHINVVDGDGNMAACTLSNGEGCGHIIPNTGIMLNNMLGEEDINPQGFFNWQCDTRISSMMAPSIITWPNDKKVALGSGGSNRIRSAILQVMVNLIHFEMPIEEATLAPRIHFERDNLNIEYGHSKAAIKTMASYFDNHMLWNDQNFFFGGVHSVVSDGEVRSGMGDPRRGGIAVRF